MEKYRILKISTPHFNSYWGRIERSDVYCVQKKGLFFGWNNIRQFRHELSAIDYVKFLSEKEIKSVIKWK